MTDHNRYYAIKEFVRGDYKSSYSSSIGDKHQINPKYPRVFQAWSEVQGLSASLSENEKIAKHHLFFGAPWQFEFRWTSPSNYYEGQSSTPYNSSGGTSLADLTTKVAAIRSLNPRIKLYVTLQYRDGYYNPDWTEWWDAPHYPIGSTYWLSDGGMIPAWGEDTDASGVISEDEITYWLLDFNSSALHEAVVNKAKALDELGIFDGIFLDWWSESWITSRNFLNPSQTYYTLQQEIDARVRLLQRIRANVSHSFEIIVNVNNQTIPNSAPYVDGAFLELSRNSSIYEGYTQEQLITAEEALHWHAHNLRSKTLTLLNGQRVVTTYGSTQEQRIAERNSAENKQWMRLFTTMALTQSDGYVLFGDHNDEPSSDHEHNWYDFWDTDLGLPTTDSGQLYDATPGLYIRYFEKGAVVYNRTDSDQTVTLTGGDYLASNLNSYGSEFTVGSLDGEIFLQEQYVYQSSLSDDYSVTEAFRYSSLSDNYKITPNVSTEVFHLRYRYKEKTKESQELDVFYAYDNYTYIPADKGWIARSAQRAVNNLPYWSNFRLDQTSNGFKVVNSTAQSIDYLWEQSKRADLFLKGENMHQCATRYKLPLTRDSYGDLIPANYNYLINSQFEVIDDYLSGWHGTFTAGEPRLDGSRWVQPTSDLVQRLALTNTNAVRFSVDVIGSGTIVAAPAGGDNQQDTLTRTFSASGVERITLDINPGFSIDLLEIRLRGSGSFAAPMLNPDATQWSCSVFQPIQWLPVSPYRYLAAFDGNTKVQLRPTTEEAVAESLLPTRAVVAETAKEVDTRSVFYRTENAYEELVDYMWGLNPDFSSDNVLITPSPYISYIDYRGELSKSPVDGSLVGVANSRTLLGMVIKKRFTNDAGDYYYKLFLYPAITPSLDGTTLQANFAVDLNIRTTYNCECYFSKDLTQLHVRATDGNLYIRDLKYDYYYVENYSVVTKENYSKVVI